MFLYSSMAQPHVPHLTYSEMAASLIQVALRCLLGGTQAALDLTQPTSILHPVLAELISWTRLSSSRQRLQS